MRISPFHSSSQSSDADRANLWPLAFSENGATSVLWPLMDFDDRGFAVRPFVSKDDQEWDVLFPLSHVDAASDEGWILNAYSTEKNRGIFPLVNVGDFSWSVPFLLPLVNVGETSWATPVYWWRDEKTHDIAGWGIFPIAHSSESFGYFLPAWWKPAHENSPAAYGVAPLFSVTQEFQQYGPVWFSGGAVQGSQNFGVFPLLWSFHDTNTLVLAPLWLRQRDERRSLDALLVPPTVWETTPQKHTHVVVPFYADVGDAKGDVSMVTPLWWSWRSKQGADDATTRMLLPLYFDKQSEGERTILTPLGGWHGNEAADSSFLGLLLPPTWWDSSPGRERDFVLPFYAHTRDADDEFTAAIPLWWSWKSKESSGHAVAPFYLYREREDARALITPLGGYGWNTDGSSRFVNVLGPVFHHESDGDSATTAILWPLYQHDRVGESDSWRLWPLYGQSNAKESPDLLHDWTLSGWRSTQDSWSAHLFPLYWGEASADASSHTALLGLARVATTPKGSAWRLAPLASGSTDAAADGLLDEFTLFRRERRDDEVKTRLFPLYWGEEQASRSAHTALFGLARVATTEQGSSWRFLPLASGSTDADADQVVDDFTLFRHERRGETSSTRLFPIYSGEHGSEVSRDEVLLSLARHERRGSGSAWRVWPIASGTTGDGMNDVLDAFTLIGVHPHPEKTHVHVGTSALFGLDLYGEDKRSWQARALTLGTFGHDEEPQGEPTVIERDHAGFLFDWFLVQNETRRAEDGTQYKARHWRLPLLHEYKSDRASKEWDALLWAVHSKETPSESRFSVLYYGYRQVRTGAETTRDIFPFITYDTAPTKSRFSFLWRLWHYERDGERRGGHILFIPWGDA